MNKAQALPTTEEVVTVKTFGDGSKMVVPPAKSESPFAALASLQRPEPVADIRDVHVEAPAVAETAGETSAPVEVAVVADAPVEESTFPASDVAEAGELSRALMERQASAPEGAKRGRRRHNKSRPEAKAHIRTPQFGGGIRKIEIVPTPEPVAPPRGSIGLFRFINKVESAAYLAQIASEITAKGGTPDVVVWSRSESGIDHARIKVVTYERGDQKGQLLARLEITEAVGVYEPLAQYVGKKLYLGEVLGKRDSIPADRVDATVALNKVLVEANERLKEADVKRKSRPQHRPTPRQEVPVAKSGK